MAVQALMRFGSAAQDLAVDIDFVLEPNAVAPAGVGGETLFVNCYIVITYNAGFDLTFTPRLDGELLTDEAVAFTVMAAREAPVTERFEFGLSRDYVVGAAVQRQGLRGTWFTFRLTGRDISQLCGVIEILEGTEIEYEVVREGLPHRDFSIGELVAVERERFSRFYFGEQGTDLFLFGSGRDDAAVPVDLFAQTNKVAPAGVGGECIFTNLYLIITHSGSSPYTLLVTPILDNDELMQLAVTVPGVSKPTVAEVFEIGLSETFAGVLTHAPRGVWFSFKVEGDGTLPDGDLIIEGASLEYEVVRETQEAQNAS